MSFIYCRCLITSLEMRYVKKGPKISYLPFGIVIAKDNVAILCGEQDMLVDLSVF